MELSIRKSEPDDQKYIAKLLMQLWPYIDIGQDERAEYVGRYLAKPDHHCILAMDDGVVVGLAIWYVVDDIQDQNRTAYLEALVVDEAFRGKGIGTRLIKEFENRCGTPEVRLHSGFRRERAHQLYERLGYNKTTYLFWKDV